MFMIMFIGVVVDVVMVDMGVPITPLHYNITPFLLCGFQVSVPSDAPEVSQPLV